MAELTHWDPLNFEEGQRVRWVGGQAELWPIGLVQDVRGSRVRIQVCAGPMAGQSTWVPSSELRHAPFSAIDYLKHGMRPQDGKQSEPVDILRRRMTPFYNNIGISVRVSQLDVANRPRVHCPKCGSALRRVYMQNPANAKGPRHPTIPDWAYCESCKTMRHIP